MTWKDSVRAVFKGFESVDDIDVDQWEDLLSKGGVKLSEDLKRKFAALGEAKRKEVVELLWGIAHEDELSPEQRLEMYERWVQFRV